MSEINCIHAIDGQGLISTVLRDFLPSLLKKKVRNKLKVKADLIFKLKEPNGKWGFESRIHNYSPATEQDSYKAILSDCVNEYIAYNDTLRIKSDFSLFANKMLNKKPRTGAELKRVFLEFLSHQRYDPATKQQFEWHEQLSSLLTQYAPAIRAQVMSYALVTNDKSEFGLYSHHFTIEETEAWCKTGIDLTAHITKRLKRYVDRQVQLNKNYFDWQKIIQDPKAFNDLNIKAPGRIQTVDQWMDEWIRKTFRDNSDAQAAAQALYEGDLSLRGGFFRTIAKKAIEELDNPAAYLIGCKGTFRADVMRNVSGGRITPPQVVKKGGALYRVVYLMHVRDRQTPEQIVQALMKRQEIQSQWLVIPDDYKSRLINPTKGNEDFILSVFKDVMSLTEQSLSKRNKKNFKVKRLSSEMPDDALEIYKKVYEQYEESKHDQDHEWTFRENFTYLIRDPEKMMLVTSIAQGVNNDEIALLLKCSKNDLMKKRRELTEALKVSLKSLEEAQLACGDML